MPDWQADDLLYDFGLCHHGPMSRERTPCTAIEAVTSMPQIFVYQNPGRRTAAIGGSGYRIETVARGLSLLHRLGAIVPPWPVIAPLHDRLRKRERITEHELGVLWGERESRTAAVFTWPETFPSTEACSWGHGHAVIAFHRGDGRLAELVLPPACRITRKEIEQVQAMGLRVSGPDIRRHITLNDASAVGQRARTARLAGFKQDRAGDGAARVLGPSTAV